MTLLKGLERCEYISKVVDDINYLIWVKDEDDNLIFANKAAFEFFKSISGGDVIKCPVEIKGHEDNQEIKICTNDECDVWLRFSSMPVYSEERNLDGILIIANDITKEKESVMKVSEIIDRRIVEWNKEKEERTRKLDENSQTIFEMLSLMKNEQGVGL